jgi:peptidoglycan/LPS O-acetylase OafA/YrhL
MSGTVGKIVFANSLRGIAAFMVMLAHYVVMFNHLQGAYGGLPALAEPPYPWLTRAIYLWLPRLDYGSLGVAIFFLVSGFVIPFSLERYGTNVTGAIAFIVARFFRLWPTYLVGVASAIAVLIAVGHIAGVQRVFEQDQVWWQLTLLRDWAGTDEITGIAWTLEIEVKFYLLCTLFGWLLMRRPLIVFAAMLGLAIVGGLRHVGYPDDGFEWSNLLFAPQFLSFMLIGTAFHHHMRGRMRGVVVFNYALISLLVFALTQPRVEGVNYIIAVVVFATCYALRHRAREIRVLGFMADISYPLYVIHPAIGYSGLRLMMGAGIPPVLALVAQILITIWLARIVHRKVEAPTHDIGRSSAKAILRRFTRRETSPALAA